jgi:hypothetical protein
VKATTPIEAEDAGRALDGVHAAEQRVEHFAVVGRSLPEQQQLLDVAICSLASLRKAGRASAE